MALDAGVDVIAHVPDTTEGTAPLLREAAAAGRWLVPTLDMFAQTVTRDRVYIDPIHASLNLFRKEDGRLLFGTDVGYLPGHDPRGELAALDACGLGVDDVLAMLTTHPAAAFGTGTGTVAPGQPGDLVLLDKLAAVTDLATVRTTIRAGQVTWARATTSRAKRKDGVSPVIAEGRLELLPFRVDGAAEPWLRSALLVRKSRWDPFQSAPATCA